MASEWHRRTQEAIIGEFEKEGYSVKRERKIGFESKVTRETQFKQVDIIAEKEDEIILVEIEDRIYRTKKYGVCEYGVGYVELGGILFLSKFFSELGYVKNKGITLLLVFRKILMVNWRIFHE